MIKIYSATQYTGLIKGLTFLLFIQISFYTFAISNSDTVSDTVLKSYRVMKFEKIKGAYIVHLKDIEKEHWFAVISPKARFCFCSKIEVGKSYLFSLKGYLEEDIMTSLDMGFWVVIEGKTYEYVRTEGWMGNIYITPNLKGLCYIRP